MPKRKLTPREKKFLQEALNADRKTVDLRLREGEYQYALAEAIASFQLNLQFPNVKEIIKELYGKEKAGNIKFRRKIQTILKKMEKSDVLQIFPKKKPWELQTYALSSFKFQDIDQNIVVFATDQQLRPVRSTLNSMSSPQENTMGKISRVKPRIYMLVFIVALSYGVILWDLTQLSANPIIYVSALSVGVVFSLILGKTLSQQ